MDSKPSRKQQTHERILEVAARAIRRVGYDGVGVAEVMKEAGLTHGGFYAHFKSRESMLAEAVAFAARSSNRGIAQEVQASVNLGVPPLQALIATYLSELHLEHVEDGCAVAALGCEIQRQSGEVRAASIAGVQALLKSVSDKLPAHLCSQEREHEAGVIVSTMVGSLQLARALGNNPQGRALLAASRSELLARHGEGMKPAPGR